jgi:hypothetical protein
MCYAGGGIRGEQWAGKCDDGGENCLGYYDCFEVALGEQPKGAEVKKDGWGLLELGLLEE